MVMDIDDDDEMYGLGLQVDIGRSTRRWSTISQLQCHRVKLRSSVVVEGHRGDGFLSRDASSLEKTKEGLVGQEGRSTFEWDLFEIR